MSGDNSDLTGFLAELQEQFGKKKKVKAIARPADIVKALNKASFDVIENRGNSLSIANSIASAEKFKEYWRPVAKESWIMTQHCCKCGYCVEYLAGEYIRFESKKLHGVLQRRIADHTDLFHFDESLKTEVCELTQDVARCPKCIRTQAEINSLFQCVFEQPVKPIEEQVELPGLDKLLDMETR